ncbi:MAG: calcineurin-like phosphoesterase family protein [Saprospiraceae bacterium]|nr:calcineurin-like phosphoesterase family protein [Saprospiraceae bacterium]
MSKNSKIYSEVSNGFLVVVCTLLFSHGFAQSRLQSGHVYLDENHNGIYERGEEPLSNVCISNGFDIVQSNEGGEYEINLRDDGVIFVIKPSGYVPAFSDDYISDFFAYHKPEGSPKYKYIGIPKTVLPDELNFALYSNPDENRLKVALLGDTQVEILDHVYHVAKLVGEQLMAEKVDFVVPLGDLVFDDLDLFDPLKKVLGKIGAPVYYVYGNHDRNYDATELQHRDETYKAHFGPSYYAFNYGKNAFLVLNTVFPENGTRKFEGRIDADQLQFVENYLNTLPDEMHVHMFMHIPLEDISNLKTLLELFKDHPNLFAYAGHTHTQYYRNFERMDGWPHDKPVEELVAGAVCGAWWLGEKDVYGVPSSMMGDGTPKGYWILEIDGSSRKCTYKISGDASNKQMHIWTPHEFTDEIGFGDKDEIIVNVFAGNNTTEVKVKIEDTDWVHMKKVLEPDPIYSRQIKLQEQRDASAEKIPFYREKFPISQHLWKIEIPEELKSGVYKLEVRAKNNIGLDAASYSLLFIK